MGISEDLLLAVPGLRIQVRESMEAGLWFVTFSSPKGNGYAIVTRQQDETADDTDAILCRLARELLEKRPRQTLLRIKAALGEQGLALFLGSR